MLSPVLFNLYIDDIKCIFDDYCDPEKLLNNPISHLLYADDLAVLSTTESGLRNCLNKLGDFCDKWQLEVNISKSKVIFNPAGRLLNGPRYYLQGKLVESVKSYCYLGVDFVCSGSFTTARTNLVEKAHKAMIPLLSIIAQFQISRDNALKLFQTMIRPIALYNSENLSHLTLHQMHAVSENSTKWVSHITTSYPEDVHQKFLKYILGLKRNCSNMATLGEVGELPLILHGWVSLLTFWHRITQMQHDTLVKQTLEYIVHDDSLKSEWFSTVKFLLSYLDMEDHLVNPQEMNPRAFSTLCKTKLKEKFIQVWINYISGSNVKEGQSSKLRSYKLFKKYFVKEPYLEFITKFNLRKTITKFRCSDHSLEIEVGRRKNLKVEDRLCKLCKSDVETELHFFQYSPVYTELRNRYFLQTQINGGLEILECKDKETAFNVANFLDKAFKLRQSLLEI